MITNYEIIPELLATYSNLLQEEIKYLETHGNNEASIKLLADLSSLLINLCFKLNNVYSVIGYDNTSILINGAKTLCKQLSMKSDDFHHQDTQFPNTYVGISSHIIGTLNRFEQTRKEERDRLLAEASKVTFERMASFRR